MYLPDTLLPIDKSTSRHIQDVWLRVIGATFVCPSSWHIIVTSNRYSDVAEETRPDGQVGQRLKSRRRRSEWLIRLSNRVELIVATSCYASPCNLSCYQKRSTIRVFLRTSCHSYRSYRQRRHMGKRPYATAETEEDTQGTQVAASCVVFIQHL